jgi:hypothetical protein
MAASDRRRTGRPGSCICRVTPCSQHGVVKNGKLSKVLALSTLLNRGGRGVRSPLDRP